jgi:hypothetical protein
MAEPKRFEGADLLRAFTLSARSFLDYAGLFAPGAVTGSYPLGPLCDDDKAMAGRFAFREAAVALTGWLSLGFNPEEWFNSGSFALRAAVPGGLAFWPNFAMVLERWGFDRDAIEGRSPIGVNLFDAGTPRGPLYVAPAELVAMAGGWEIMARASRAEGGSSGPMWLTVTADGIYKARPATAEVRVEFDPDGVSAEIIIGGEEPIKATAEQGHFIQELAKAEGRPMTFAAMKEACPALAYVTNQSRFVAGLPARPRALVESVTGYRLAVENL